MGRTKARLLAGYDRLHSPAAGLRFWAMYVSVTEDATEFADAVRSRGPNWRPVVVRPERAAEAAAAVQPALVVIDAAVPDPAEIVASVSRQSPSSVISPAGQ